MPSQKRAIAKTVKGALLEFNKDTQNSWSFGANWNNQGTAFETFVNNYLFPKLNETLIVETVSGNRFDFLAKEEDFIGQYSEEYVILDSVPIGLDLEKNVELMLKRNYPNMATKIYQQGIVKKLKFTLNNNDNRLNWSTIGDAISYALSVYRKKINDINIAEEAEIKAMLMDYANNIAVDKRTVNSYQELFQTISESILNLQNNSAKHNEASLASGGAMGRYTTSTKLKDVLILTTDKAKAYLLDTKLANTFQVAGIDLSNHIISFDDLGGVYKTTKDIKVTSTMLPLLKAMGDYQIEVDDIIPAQSVFTYDITSIFQDTDFEEIKPKGEYFAFLFDVRTIRYKRSTKGMLKQPFYNGEFDEITYWLHYYSMKSISPFYNKVVITSK